jgi:flavin-dependent dehydrogenase
MSAAPVLKPFYDAVIVGARCAGAATALLLARRGLQVLAFDRSPYGSDTLSTHALMRAAILQLGRWGVLDRIQAAGTPAVRHTEFHYGDEVVGVTIKPRDGVDALYAPRRTVLDRALVDAAVSAGAEIVHGPRMTDLLREPDGRVRGVEIEHRGGEVQEIGARIVIGADGFTSSVARLVDAPLCHTGLHASGIVYGYWAGLPLHGYHWYYGPGVGAGAIETNDGLTCVFATVPASRFKAEIQHDMADGYHAVIAKVDAGLAAAVQAGRLVGPLRGFSGHPGHLRQSWGPGWALVGDAAYFKDPFTAHGITDALRDADLLARAVAGGSDSAMAAYQATRDRLSLGMLAASDAIASFEWDYSALKGHHLAISRSMADEVLHLSGLEPDVVAMAG